jgi:methylenetetrahydrofolate reductase (NADPH)
MPRTSPLQRLDDEERASLRALLERPRYEILPLPGIARRARRVDSEVSFSVTAAPPGMDPTIDLAVALAEAGRRVMPHLAAQLFADGDELARCVHRLTESGISEVLVIGGVTDQPGEFPDAHSLLEELGTLGAGFAEIGIAGYPEGHPEIPEARLEEALAIKIPLATQVTTQMTYRAASVIEWVNDRDQGPLSLPIHVGVPGVAGPVSVASFGVRSGLARALTFAYRHPRLVAGMLRPGDKRSIRLVGQIGAAAAHGDLEVAGLHIYTFNQLSKTERWRRAILRRLA